MSRANILVNLKHNAKKAKNEIKKNLQEVDKENVSPDFDIGDDGQIKELEAKLAKLSRKREAEIEPEIDKKKLAQVEAQLKGIGGGGIGSPEDFDAFGGLDSQGNRGTARLKSVDIDKASIKEMGVSADDVTPESTYHKRNVPIPRDDETGLITGGKGDPRGLLTKGKRPGSESDPRGGVNADIFDGILDKFGPEQRGQKLPVKTPRQVIRENTLGETFGPESGIRYSQSGAHVGGDSTSRGVRRSAKRAKDATRRKSSMGSFTTPDKRKLKKASAQAQNLKEAVGDISPPTVKESVASKSGFSYSPSQAKGDMFGPKRAKGIDKVTNKIEQFAHGLGDSNGKINKNAISMGRMKKQMSGFGRKLKKVIPNMSTWYNLFAVLIPVIASLAVQAAGVAVAMGAVAAAGASMIGLGLIGHGENLGEAMENAGNKVDELKKSLFQTFKPALQTFAPISDEFMKNLPQRVQPLVEPLKGLTVFEDTFIAAFNGLVSWTGEVIDTLVSYSAKLDQISMRFGSLLGEGLLKVLRWLIEYSYKNQDAMLELYSVFRSIIGSVWRLIKTLSIFLAMLEPLFSVVYKVAKALDNRWGSALIIVIALLYIVVGLVTSLAAKMLILVQLGVWSTLTAQVGGFLSAMRLAIAAIAQAIGMTYSLAAAIAATGVGALLVGGGILAGQALIGSVKNSAPGMDRSQTRTGGSAAGYGGQTTVNNDITVKGDDAVKAARDIEGLDGWYKGMEDKDDAMSR